MYTDSMRSARFSNGPIIGNHEGQENASQYMLTLNKCNNVDLVVFYVKYYCSVDVSLNSHSYWI